MTQGTGTWKSREQPGCSTSDLDFCCCICVSIRRRRRRRLWAAGQQEAGVIRARVFGLTWSPDSFVTKIIPNVCTKG